MDAFIELFHTLKELFWSLLDVVVALFRVVLPWLPLLAWVGFWALAVNWVKAFQVLWRGGWIGVLLLMIAAVIVWGAVAPPESGYHHILGLTVSNHVGKFIFVSMLTCIALLCGSAQMNGFAKGLVSYGADDDSSAGH